MNTDIRQQIEAALRAFFGADLRAAAIGLLNSLGYQSEKTLDLGGSPEIFLEQFDNNRDQVDRRGLRPWLKWRGSLVSLTGAASFNK